MNLKNFSPFPPPRSRRIFVAYLLASLGIPGSLLADMVVHLGDIANYGPVNLVENGPLLTNGNGLPQTTTQAYVVDESPSGDGKSLHLIANRVVSFHETEAFRFLKNGIFTISAMIRVEAESPDGSAYLFNHWHYENTDRSLAIRLRAKNFLVTPSVIVREETDTQHESFDFEDKAFPTGQWVHLVIVSDGKTLRFWVNGEESALQFKMPAMRASSLPVYVGGVGFAIQDDPGLAVDVYDLKILDQAVSPEWMEADFEASR